MFMRQNSPVGKPTALRENLGIFLVGLFAFRIKSTVVRRVRRVVLRLRNRRATLRVSRPRRLWGPLGRALKLTVASSLKQL